MLQRICVFCGSSSGDAPIYREAASEMGVLLANRGIELVYGGGKVGLMGAIANACLQAGGTVIGVIPQALVDKEIGHGELTDLRIVGTMHERKAMMADLADAFIAMPGGWGTLDEFCEILTWSQLGIHHKPSGLLNVNGYYDPFLQMADHAVEEGFVRKVHRDLVITDSNPSLLLDRLKSYQVPFVDKWLDSSKR